MLALLAAQLAGQDWPLKRIQDHLNAYLAQRGPKSVLTDDRKGHARGAARYRNAGQAANAEASAAIHALFEEELAAGRLVWHRGKIVEAPRPRVVKSVVE